MSDGTKADDIALALEEAIVSGEIPPGSTLRQEHVSEQFQVSRTPVREALRRLAALGLVSFEPNRGVRVRMLSLDEIREAFMVRAELESLATEIATPKMTDDDLAELERAERRFHRATERLVEMSHDGRQDLEVAREWHVRTRSSVYARMNGTVIVTCTRSGSTNSGRSRNFLMTEKM